MKIQLEIKGHQSYAPIYTSSEIENILHYLQSQNLNQQFGIRAFLKSHSDLLPLLFNSNLTKVIKRLSANAKLIKSIYFDKPPNANWIVNWHQDLTINVNGKIDDPGFKNWRVLKDRTVVQAPIEILENIFTIRIHLDNCTSANGALRVINSSHKKGVIPIKDGIEKWLADESICEVERGGVLVMKPLILHASRRAENEMPRRVIHLEFCDLDLPDGLVWNEEVEF